MKFETPREGYIHHGVFLVQCFSPAPPSPGQVVHRWAGSWAHRTIRLPRLYDRGRRPASTPEDEAPSQGQGRGQCWEDSALAAAGGRSERTHSQAEPCPHGSPLGSTVQFLQRFRRKVAQHRPKALAAMSNLSGAGTERRQHLSSAYRLSRGHFQPWESHERALGGGGCGAFGDWKAAWLRRGSGTGALKDSERLSA